MARRYRKPPSDLIGIDDPYTAWCLDEALSYVIYQMERGKRARLPKGSNGAPRTNADLIEVLKAKKGIQVVN